MFYPEIKGMNLVKKLRDEGKIEEVLQIISELEHRDDLSLKELCSYKLVKAELLQELGNILDANEIAKEIFQEFQKIGDLVSAFKALLIQAYSYMITTNLRKSEDIIRQAEDLLKVIKAIFSIDLRERESYLARIKAGIFFFKGQIRESLEFNKKAYRLAKDTGNKVLISICLNNIADKYYHLKEYDKAINYAKRALELIQTPQSAVAFSTLIEINVTKGDIKEAKHYLDLLRDYSEKFSSKWSNAFYQSSRGLILKSSLRARDRIKAEDLFKELASDNTISSELRIEAIIHLCDLYLTELQLTNDPDVITEIYPYIQELIRISEKDHLYLYLAETHILQAKLSLLTLDIKKAKQFLIQAQNIAESYGMRRLAMKISLEHDELLRQTKMWEDLKASGVNLTERLELAGLNEQMENMVKKRMIEIPEISKENPVMLLFLTEGGNLLFSKQFVEDFSFEDDILGGFLTSINYFITEVFSEGLDRAIFGKHTLLMMPLQPFLVVYIFKGDSYYAHRKLKNFLNSIQNDSAIWQSLKKFLQQSKIIQLNDIPSLESMVMKIFTSKKN